MNAKSSALCARRFAAQSYWHSCPVVGCLILVTLASQCAFADRTIRAVHTHAHGNYPLIAIGDESSGPQGWDAWGAYGITDFMVIRFGARTEAFGDSWRFDDATRQDYTDYLAALDQRHDAEPTEDQFLWVSVRYAGGEEAVASFGYAAGTDDYINEWGCEYTGVPCPNDQEFYDKSLHRRVIAAANLSLEHSVIEGFYIDFELYKNELTNTNTSSLQLPTGATQGCIDNKDKYCTSYANRYVSACFCDSCFQGFMDEECELEGEPLPEKYTRRAKLVEWGLLDEYNDRQLEGAERRATATRLAAHAINPSFKFGSYRGDGREIICRADYPFASGEAAPFYLGFRRGMSTGSKPYYDFYSSYTRGFLARNINFPQAGLIGHFDHKWLWDECNWDPDANQALHPVGEDCKRAGHTRYMTGLWPTEAWFTSDKPIYTVTGAASTGTADRQVFETHVLAAQQYGDGVWFYWSPTPEAEICNNDIDDDKDGYVNETECKFFCPDACCDDGAMPTTHSLTEYLQAIEDAFLDYGAANGTGLPDCDGSNFPCICRDTNLDDVADETPCYCDFGTDGLAAAGDCFPAIATNKPCAVGNNPSLPTYDGDESCIDVADCDVVNCNSSYSCVTVACVAGSCICELDDSVCNLVSVCDSNAADARLCRPDLAEAGVQRPLANGCVNPPTGGWCNTAWSCDDTDPEEFCLCDGNDDCSDGFFCNGVESCSNGSCIDGTVCDEADDCDAVNDHCDDRTCGGFCSQGAECIAGSCEIVTLYVDANVNCGAGTCESGLSWDTAYTFLQDALDEVSNYPYVREIRVADGTYLPDEGTSPNAGDRDATFNLLDAVEIKGGYAGDGAPDPDARNISVNETILSGDLNGDGPFFTTSEECTDDSDCAGGTQPYCINGYCADPSGVATDNSYHVVTAIGVGETAVLDGFTITGGVALDNCAASPPNDCRGGGMLVTGSPTIKSCTFDVNSAGSGGAVFIYDDASFAAPTFDDCRFTNNRASLGGAVAVGAGGMPTFISICHFLGNAADNGGAIAVTGDSFDSAATAPLFDGPHFVRYNTAYATGGAVYHEDAHGRFETCLIQYNRSVSRTTGQGAGAVMLVSDSSVTCADADAKFVSCDFRENSSRRYGGAVISANGAALFDGCSFTRNITDDVVSMTQYANAGGAIYALANGGIEIVDCKFYGNTAADSGGAIAFHDEVTGGNPAEIVNSVFVGNTAATIGGAILNSKATIGVTNCTFTENTATASSGGALYIYQGTLDAINSIFWNDDPDEYVSVSSTTSITYSDIDGLTGFSLTNFDLDPKFVSVPSDGGDGWGNANDDYGDLRLAQDCDCTTDPCTEDVNHSPCIDAGSCGHATPPPVCAATDIDGNAREAYGGCAASGTAVVDVGAYELQ